MEMRADLHPCLFATHIILLVSLGQYTAVQPLGDRTAAAGRLLADDCLNAHMHCSPRCRRLSLPRRVQFFCPTLPMFSSLSLTIEYTKRDNYSQAPIRPNKNSKSKKGKGRSRCLMSSHWGGYLLHTVSNQPLLRAIISRNHIVACILSIRIIAFVSCEPSRKHRIKNYPRVSRDPVNPPNSPSFRSPKRGTLHTQLTSKTILSQPQK